MIKVHAIDYKSDRDSHDVVKSFALLSQARDWMVEEAGGRTRFGGNASLSPVRKTRIGEDVQRIDLGMDAGGRSLWVVKVTDSGRGCLYSSGMLTNGRKHCGSTVKVLMDEVAEDLDGMEEFVD